jgi:hypothetical protein
VKARSEGRGVKQVRGVVIRGAVGCGYRAARTGKDPGPDRRRRDRLTKPNEVAGGER